MKEIKERIKQMIDNNKIAIKENSNKEGLSDIVKAMHEARVIELVYANMDLKEILEMLEGVSGGND